MKRIRWMLMISLVLILTGCHAAQKLSEQDDRLKEKDLLDEAYQAYVPTIDAVEVLDVSELTIPAELNNLKVSCAELYDDSSLIILLYAENPTYRMYEIGKYDHRSGEYKKLIDVPEGTAFEICDISKDYLISRWSPDNWLTCELKYYDFGKDELRSLLKYSIDPETSYVYRDNVNSVIYADGNIYFDDFYADENNDLTVSLFQFNPQSGQTVAYKDMQNPIVFQDKIVAFKKDSSGRFRDIASLDDTFRLEGIDQLFAVKATDYGIFNITSEVANANEDAYDTIRTIKNIKDNVQILSTHTPIGYLESNNRFIAWKNYDPAIPTMLDTKTNKLLSFTMLPAGVNNYFFSGYNDESGVISNTVDGHNRIFLLTIKD